jgi:hypothetical protein
MPQGYISRMETGYQQDIYLSNAHALAQALGVTLEEMLTDSAAITPPSSRR